ncbi:hypothetical protein GCM10023340_36490 [Nocardioides marinquilinus]|uniref:Terminase n=1 Tax=Nocardioides marinquilinus TaxID=1210400 RepID=A0ABP9Q2S7_9ACTN
MVSNNWSGRRVTRARDIVRTWLPAPCGQCGETVSDEDVWVVGHKVARAIDPSLTWVVSNWQPEHDACSRRSAQSVVIEKAKAEVTGFFPDRGESGSPRTFPSLPPSARRRQEVPLEPREGLEWAPAAWEHLPWLAAFATVPPDASPPLHMSPPHPEAVDSYGASAVEWIERTQGIEFRWWQRLAIVRQLEHRDDGSLCWSTILESAPRRAGKSVRIRGVALWRMALGPTLFGERQEIVHTGSDIAVCRKVQKAAWQWCWSQEWTVTKANGKEAIESTTGDVWYVRAQDATYGWDTTLALVDEAWDVKPDTVDEGLEPSLLERQSPQLHMTSTAHRRARSTMRTRLADAITRDDGETLLLLWGIPAGADIGDPDAWRAASPYWTESRRRMIAAKYQKAMAGESDPEADDPDPVAGFEAQYLNRWRLSERRQAAGTEVIDADVWGSLVVLPDDDAKPVGAAIEAWFDAGLSLALAYREGDRVVVVVVDYPDIHSAVTALKASGFRGRVAVGASLKDDPALANVARTPMGERLTASVVDLARLVAERGLHHDGGDHLTEQVIALRTVPAPDGARVVSKHRADAVKAAVWAVEVARKRTSGPVRIGLPTSVRAS